MKKIAILLTCHNRRRATIKSLSSLYNAINLIPNDCVDVYLVNDGSTDGTEEEIRRFFPEVNIINGNGNLFWNRGMILAWQTAMNNFNYDFYCWLNDDTYLIPQALKVLTEAYIAFDHDVILVGSTCSSKSKNQITYGGLTRQNRIVFDSKQFQECHHFNGNIVLIPKSVFEKVGYLDDRFRHSLGDFDYGLRSRKLGVNSFVVPQILGECDEHKELPQWCNPNFTFLDRWKIFRSPLGNNPEEHFYFNHRHFGIIPATFHYFTNHLRVFFPRIWRT